MSCTSAPPAIRPVISACLTLARIPAEVVADNEALAGTAPRDQRRQAEPDRIEPHQVDLPREQPARVVLAEPRRLDQRQSLEIGCVWLQVGAWFRQHGGLVVDAGLADRGERQRNSAPRPRQAVSRVQARRARKGRAPNRLSAIRLSCSQHHIPADLGLASLAEERHAEQRRSSWPGWLTAAATLRTEMSPIRTWSRVTAQRGPRRWPYSPLPKSAAPGKTPAAWASS